MAVAARERLGPLALPFLEELMRVSGETANLSVLESNATVYVEQAAPRRMLRIFTEPGNRVSLHSTGSGEVLLAYQPPRLVDLILGSGDLTRQTASTITDPAQLATELRLVREQGYAVDYEEQEEGVRCLAAPVFGLDGDLFAAMSLSGPASRLDRKRIDALVPHLKRVYASLSDSLDPW
jgi:IclR family acetate operon transcriptional repressor